MLYILHHILHNDLYTLFYIFISFEIDLYLNLFYMDVGEGSFKRDIKEKKCHFQHLANCIKGLCGRGAYLYCGLAG